MEDERKTLLEEYSRILEKMLRKGMVRSGNPRSDYGEYLAAKRLGLELVMDCRKPYDAIDNEGKKYEIKTKRDWSYKQKKGGPQLKLNQLEACDYLVYVELNSQWDLTKLLCIPSKEVKHRGKRLIIDEEIIRRFNALDFIQR